MWKLTAYHINRRTNTNSEKTCPQTSEKMSDNIICESRNFQNCLHCNSWIRNSSEWEKKRDWFVIYWVHLLHLIIAGKFSSINNGISCYIGSNTGPECPNSFLIVRKPCKNSRVEILIDHPLSVSFFLFFSPPLSWVRHTTCLTIVE